VDCVHFTRDRLNKVADVLVLLWTYQQERRECQREVLVSYRAMMAMSASLRFTVSTWACVSILEHTSDFIAGWMSYAGTYPNVVELHIAVVEVAVISYRRIVDDKTTLHCMH
jgi:hypothetical protein